MDKLLGDQKNVNCIPLFLCVSPCSLYYCLFKTQRSEVELEPVFWVHGDWRCQGPFKSGGTLRTLFLVSLWAAKKVSWGILSGPGQREAEAFFSFSLNSVGNCLGQVSEKLYLSILGCFGENVLTLFLATVARSNPCS